VVVHCSSRPVLVCNHKRNEPPSTWAHEDAEGSRGPHADRKEEPLSIRRGAQNNRFHSIAPIQCESALVVVATAVLRYFPRVKGQISPIPRTCLDPSAPMCAVGYHALSPSLL